MVISTIGPLEERQPVVCVSPILTEEDEKSIEKLVKTVSRKLHQRKEAVDGKKRDVYKRQTLHSTITIKHWTLPCNTETKAG